MSMSYAQKTQWMNIFEYIQDNIDNYDDGEADEEYEPLEYETVVCVN